MDGKSTLPHAFSNAPEVLHWHLPRRPTAGQPHRLKNCLKDRGIRDIFANGDDTLKKVFDLLNTKEFNFHYLSIPPALSRLTSFKCNYVMENLGGIEQWAFLEFLSANPELLLKNIEPGECGNTDSEDEHLKTDVYQYITDGAVRFVNDIRKIFGDDLDFNQLMFPNLRQALCCNPSSSDKYFMRNLCFFDVCDGRYKRMFRLW